MSWLRNKIIAWALKNERNEKVAVAGSQAVLRVSDEPDIDGLRFTVMTATGGVILQCRTYDRQRDRNNTATYIIAEGEPVAERVGQIVSMEILKS